MECPIICVNLIVREGGSTLMSISEGLGPSEFCRKMEKTRPMDGMEWMEKVFISR